MILATNQQKASLVTFSYFCLLPFTFYLPSLIFFFPAFHCQQGTDWILHGEIKGKQFLLPVRPIVAIEKGNFPNAICRFQQLAID